MFGKLGALNTFLTYDICNFIMMSFLQYVTILYYRGFPCSSVSKESTCNAGDLGSIPGSGRSPGEGNGKYSSILAWEILWTEEPGGLQSTGSQESDVAEPPLPHGKSGKICSLRIQALEPDCSTEIPLRYSCLGNSIARGAGGPQSMGSQRVRHD